METTESGVTLHITKKRALERGEAILLRVHSHITSFRSAALWAGDEAEYNFLTDVAASLLPLRRRIREEQEELKRKIYWERAEHNKARLSKKQERQLAAIEYREEFHPLELERAA